MWHSLVYDKYAGNHQFSNDITKKVSINDLTEKNGYSVLIGDDAIKKCNSFPENPNTIPDLDKNLYKVKLYEKNEVIPSYYTIVDINIEELKNYISNNNKLNVPNYDFMKTLMRYHNFYKKAEENVQIFTSIYTSIAQNSLIFGNIHSVVKNVMKASTYKAHESIEDPKDITATLFQYQKCSIYWMIQKEKFKNKKENTVYYNTSKELSMGDVYFDFYNGKFNLANNRKNLTFSGGAIIDEVGLGKTLQVTTLALLHQSKNTDYITKGSNKFKSRATLVLCPNHLCGQWKRELKKMINKDYDPSIISLLTKKNFDTLTYQDLLDADFVIVSYTFLDNKVFHSKWVKELNVTLKNYHKSQMFDHEKVQKTFDKLSQNLINNPLDSLDQEGPLIQLIDWHRFVIDEFHEIYTNSKYSYIRNLLPHIKSDYRWIVTGTPFNSDDNLYHMIDFLTDYKNKDGKQILVSHDIIKYLCTDCFRRNTKDSVVDEFKLPPYKEEILLLDFTPTERVMYNAYLSNPRNDKYSIYLRQLCCHPNLAEETKKSLSSCKTLEDIEKMMISHYKSKTTKELIKMMNTKSKIKLLKKEIEKKTQETELRKIGTRLVQSKKNNYKKRDDIPDSVLIKIYNKEQDVKYKKPEQFVIKSYDSDYDDVDDELIKENSNKITKIKDDNNDDYLDDYLAVVMASLDNDDDNDNDDSNSNNDTNTNIRTVSLSALKDSLTRAEKRYKDLKANYQGNKSTYIYYTNVIERLRKTMTKEKIVKQPDLPQTNGGNIIDILNCGLNSDSDDDSDSEDVCGICLDEIVNGNVGITDCGHIFCYSCLNEVYSASIKMTYGKPKCPTCRRDITKDNIHKLSCVIKKDDEDNNKKKDVTKLDKSYLINKVGTKLGNLICFLRKNTEHTILFSQWNDLLCKVGAVLKEYGIKNIFCRGNVYQRDKAIREFNTNDKIKVIMLSSESAASGTNLTKAKRVILLDPVYGNYQHRKDTEQQAIGRTHRLGQTNKLVVTRFVIKDTIEEEIYKKNIEEDKKYPEYEGREIVEISKI